MKKALNIFILTATLLNTPFVFATNVDQEVPKPSALQEFLTKFYHENGMPLSVSELIGRFKTRGKTEFLQATPEADRTYRRLFRKSAHSLWFLQDSPEKLDAFEQAFWQRDLANGVINYMQYIYENANITPRKIGRTTRFEIGTEADAMMVNEMLEALHSVCVVNLGFCVTLFIKQLDQNPRLFSLLNETARDRVVEMIGFVFRQDPLPMVRERGFGPLHRTRKRILKHDPCDRLLKL